MKYLSHSKFVPLKSLPGIFAVVWCSLAVIGFALDYLTEVA